MDEHDLEDLARRTAPARRVIARAMVAGAALLVVYGAWRWWHDERVFARTLPTECALTAKNVDWTMRGGGSRRMRTRPLWLDGTAHLKLTHTLEGRRFAATADAPRPERFQVGKSYPCRYDPLDPSRVTVATSFEPDTDSFFWAALVLMAVFFVRPDRRHFPSATS